MFGLPSSFELLVIFLAGFGLFGGGPPKVVYYTGRMIGAVQFHLPLSPRHSMIITAITVIRVAAICLLLLR